MAGIDSGPAPPARRGRIRWAFLDRDGTLNVKAPDGEYVRRAQELVLLPGAAQAVAALNRAGVWVGVVTNQRGVALGRMSSADVDAVHARLRGLLAEEGARVDAIYVCPHEAGTCDCRKPAPGMLLAARAENPDIDFAQAAMVGDSASDMQAGRSLGLATIFVGDRASDPAGASLADELARDLLGAVQLLV